MIRTVPFSCLAIAVATLVACAGNPKPGEAGYPYNLAGAYQAEFIVEGTAYRGDMALETRSGGVLSGDFTVEPGNVIGSVEGTIQADSVSFQMPYEILENGCSGVVSGKAAVSLGGTGFAGPIQLDDSCGGEISGTVAVTR